MAASLLRAIGLDELVTHTLDAYQEKALHLAHQPLEVERLKQKLAANRHTYPLFDTARCTRHIEAAYVQMWQRFDTGLPPDHLRLSHTSDAPGSERDTIENPLP
jgi:predicted O-linked N-acetylglucosamine transferase (SPINDLY family)